MGGGACFIALGLGACVAIVTSYALRWPVWIGWSSLGVAAVGFWWHWRMYRALQFLAWQNGVSIESAADVPETAPLSASEELIRGAAQCISVAGNGGELPEIEDDARKHLLDSYGEEWLQANEELLQAMLAFVDDFRAFAGPDGGELREIYEGDPRETCLLSIFQCVLRAGALTQPTLQLGEPNLSSFVTSFGLWHEGSMATSEGTDTGTDDFTELAGAGTSLILMAAMSFGMDVFKHGQAA